MRWSLLLLMVALRVTELCVRGSEYGFGSPADILIGAFGEPGAYARSFQLNSFQIAFTGNLTEALTAGLLPPVVLVCLGLRRTAVAVAAFVPLAFLTVALTSNYTLGGGPRTAGTLYAYGLETLALLASAGAPLGWKTLRWRLGALLAAGTAALSRMASWSGCWESGQEAWAAGC